MDQESDEEYDDRVDASFYLSARGDGGGGGAVSDLVSGRSTLFCCLSCGIPFAFPDDSYIYDNANVQRNLRFTHMVRRQLRLHDRSRASTTQWQLNMSHYVHSYLHKQIAGSLLLHSFHGSENSSSSEATRPKRRGWWDKGFVTAAARLIAAVQDIGSRENSQLSFVAPPIVLDDALLNVKHPWCNGCNIAATHATRTKQQLGLLDPKKKNRKHRHLPHVPDARALPMGMRIMHDTYVFIYLMATFLGVLVARSSESPDISPTECFRHDCLIRLYVAYLLLTFSHVFLTQCFRHDCLIRLYVAYLLHTLASRLCCSCGSGESPFLPGLSFEHWHMFYFNELQLWERQNVHASAGTKKSNVLTNLAFRVRRRSGGAQGEKDKEWVEQEEDEMSYGPQRTLEDILNRVAELAEEHWFVIDMRLQSRRKGDKACRALHRDFYDWLPWKTDANDTVHYVTQHPASRLAPAPFCCAPDNIFFEQNMFYDAKSRKKQPYARHMIPQSLFFHRLYVNLDMHFGSRAELHAALAAFLPQVYGELQGTHESEWEVRRAALLLERERQLAAADRRSRRVPLLGAM